MIKKLILVVLGFCLCVTAFSQETKTELETRYNVIRNETAPGGNTRARVADAYQKTSDATQSLYYPVASGTNTYTATILNVATYAGKWFVIYFTNGNTGASTLNINGIGPIAIKKDVSAALVSGDIIASKVYILHFDGTNFQIDIGTASNVVLSSRLINTTSPITGGGDLSADRTIAIDNAAADGSTKGAASFTAVDFNSSSGNISIDYANGQEATAGQDGFLSSTDWSTFNNKQSTGLSWLLASGGTLTNTNAISGPYGMIWNNSTSANGSIAHSYTSTVTATANNDLLYLVNLSETINIASKTGVTYYALYHNPTLQNDNSSIRYFIYSNAGGWYLNNVVPNVNTLTGTWTATANNQYHASFSGSFTSRNTAADNLYGYSFTPTLTQNAGNPISQSLIAVSIMPTFNVTGTPATKYALELNNNMLFSGSTAKLIKINGAVNLLDINVTSNSWALTNTAGYGITNSTTDLQLNSQGNLSFKSQATVSNTFFFGDQGGSPTTVRIFSVIAGAVPSVSTAYTPTSGESGLVQIGASNGNANFQPSSGTATHFVLRLKDNINQTGSASGRITDLLIDPVLTNVLGTKVGVLYSPTGTYPGSTHIAFRSDLGSVFFANASSDAITSGARVDIRGTGTTTNKAIRIADSGNTERLYVTDGGNLVVGANNNIVGTATNNNAAAGNIGEEVNSTISTYTNYTTTATYQAVTSITLTAGDWDISAFCSYSANAATITAGSNAIFVISTTSASAAGATEGKNIIYIPQAALLGTSIFSDAIAPYRVSLSGSTTYYLNSQATFTLGNPQFVGTIRARRIR